MNRKKMLLLSLSLILVVALAVGGTTFALLTANAQNSGNNFTAGTVAVSAVRDDVPFTGPMFYSSSTSAQPGYLPTGLWAPGDKHTRGLFLSSTGSLDARLAELKAVPAEVNDINTSFADNAHVIIWNLNWYRSTGLCIGPKLSSDDMKEIMDSVNEAYSKWLNRNPRWWEYIGYAADQAKISLGEAVNAALLATINNLDCSPNLDGKVIKVTKIFTDKLSALVAGDDVTSYDIELAKGDTAMLGFTVEMDLGAGNDLQGSSPMFTFQTTWEQVRNNP